MSRSKKEIDKELMYKKLMPSQSKQKASEEMPGDIAAPLLESAKTTPAPEAAAPHRAPEPHKVEIPSMDRHKTEIVNMMEEIVLSKLDGVLSRFQCCRCDRCKKDIVALALNKLPPRYMVLVHGQPVPDIDAQTNAQVITAMIQAAIRVRAKPRH
ncbi:MAG: late competence development ComFB family protein [Oscillospiraceae bacterium]|jgi:hypothetical protein|nr:late competence development ComFB family protein [Oscillospiraceae bacterium]